MTTGQRIQQARKAAKLSQRQLGKILGVSGSMIGQYENDLRNPKQATIQRIAIALNTDINWLNSGKTNNEQPVLCPLHNTQACLSQTHEELLTQYQKLNHAHQREALNYINYLIQKQNSGGIKIMTDTQTKIETTPIRFIPCGPDNTPSRYQIYRHATGDTDWGQAPVWLNDQYFKFCDQTQRKANGMMSPSGKPMAMLQPDEQVPFHAWLMETFWPDYDPANPVY